MASSHGEADAVVASEAYAACTLGVLRALEKKKNETPPHRVVRKEISFF